MLTGVAAARADDFAATARSIIPSGQFGGFSAPPGADARARMYDALTPLFNRPGTPEAVPHPGVTLVRDRCDVPHITAKTRDGVTFALGWTLAQGRYPARLAASDALSLVTGLKTYKPTKRVDRTILRNGLRALRSQVRAGRALLHDVDVYVRGINARLKFEHSSAKPFTRVDIFAVNALSGQIFGQGGGGEAPRSELLASLRRRLGAPKAMRLFDDLTETDDADAPSTLTEAFPYERVPRRHPGKVVLDPGSLRPTDRAAFLATTIRYTNRPSGIQQVITFGGHRSRR